MWLKDEMATKLLDSLVYLNKQNGFLNEVKSLKDENEALKSKLIDCQKTVIGLQSELLASRTDQLETLQATVNTVKDTVKAELSSHSESLQSAVKAGIRSTWSEVAAKSSSQNMTSTVQLKQAVKSAVAEDDRSKNFMIFGKEEVPNEDVPSIVAGVMEDINEKPRIVECARVGQIVEGKSRPIKVKLTSFDAVLNVLRRARLLNNSTSNRDTFIASDKTLKRRMSGPLIRSWSIN